MREGQHVLVLGATSVTGALAVQLAKAAFGAVRVVAAGRNAARLEWLQTVGADAVIPLEAKDLAMRVAAQHRVQPFDVVLDYLWGSPAEQVLAALGNVDPNASFHVTRFVQIGEMGRARVSPFRPKFYAARELSWWAWDSAVCQPPHGLAQLLTTCRAYSIWSLAVG